jgi:hypothetical protein
MKDMKAKSYIGMERLAQNRRQESCSKAILGLITNDDRVNY